MCTSKESSSGVTSHTEGYKQSCQFKGPSYEVTETLQTTQDSKILLIVLTVFLSDWMHMSEGLRKLALYNQIGSIGDNYKTFQ